MNKEEIEKYLNDLDNLIETGHFPNESVEDFTFYHQEMTLKQFISKGRKIILESLPSKAPEGEWISVEDELPEHLQKVLIFGHIQNYSNTKEIYSGILNRAGNLNEWLSLGKRIIAIKWQPLPEPPKTATT